MLADLWDRATTTQPPLTWQVSVLLGVLAVAVTWSPVGYRVVRHLNTLIHEAGHAMAAVLVGRRLSGVRLHSDTSGVTVSRGNPRGFGMILTLLAGYPAPALLGLAGAYAVAGGWAAGLLWALVLLCGLVMLLIRNLYGAVVVVGIGGSVAALTWVAPQSVLSGLAYLLVWTLLLAAPRAVLELHRRGRHSGSDADQLARLTPLPALFWIGLFWLSCLACLALGALRLLQAS